MPRRRAKSSRKKPEEARPPFRDPKAENLESLAVELRTQRGELEAQNEELRQSQLRLEDSRDRYADLFDFAPIAYVTLDYKGGIRDLNLAAAALLGIGRRSAMGIPFVTLVRPEHGARFWDHIARCRRGALHLTTDLELRIRSDDHYPVSLVTAPNQRPEKLPELRTAVLDLSDRRALEEQRADLVREAARREEAERTSKMKDEFLALLAHELRTPIGAIHGWTHLLTLGQMSPDEQRRALDIIERNVQIQVGLLDQMLELSKIIHGSVDLDMTAVDVLALVTSVMESVRPMAQEKGLTFEARLDPIVGRVHGDVSRLRQIVSNVLVNAIKFTPEGGKIDLQLGRGIRMYPRLSSAGSAERMEGAHDEVARLVIADTGVGISAVDLPRVFDRFWKGSADGRKSKGLGIGLAVVRRLVELHGGSVRADSPGPGQGATFSIELPLAVGRPASRPRVRAADGSVEVNGLRVVVADDEPEALELVKRQLEPLGIAVETVSSAPEAVEAVRRLRPDVLVSDLSMPGADGFELIRVVRALPESEGGATPAIALTAYASAGDEDRALEAGFETYATKPIPADRLGTLIGRLAERARRSSPTS